MAKHTLEELLALRNVRKLTHAERSYLSWLENKDSYRAYIKEWRLKNPEKTAAQAARARQNKLVKDPEFERRNIARWRANHPEDQEKRLAAYQADPEEFRERARRSRAKHPETMRADVRKRRARRLAAPGEHTREETDRLFEAQNRKCLNPYCGCELTSKNRHLDHVVPLSKGGSDGIENLRWLCASCNLRKKDFDEQTWLARESRRAAKALGFLPELALPKVS